MKRPLTPEEISAITEAGYDISGYDGRAVDIPDDLYGSTKTSSVAAGGRAALASAIPTAAGGAAFMPAFTAGTALSAPLGPFAPIGGVVAGLAAGYGASRLAGAGQQALMPQSWEQQLATDVEQHPTATKIGQLATIPLGGMRPSISGTRAALSGLSRLATGAPVSVAEKQALMLAGGGAALGAGQEAVVAPIEGRPVELGNVLEAAGMGAAFNRPTKFAQKYYGFHDIPQRTVDSPEALAALQRARAASDPAQTASDPTTRATVAKPNLRQESLLDAINRSVNAPVEGTPVYTKPAKQSAERILKGEQENKPLVKRMEDEDLLATIEKQATAKRPRFQEEGDGLSPLQGEVEEGLKGRKLSTTPSQQYVDTLTNELLTTKNIKVSADTTLVNEDGAPVKGVALLPNAVREVVINPEKASIDTLPHEALHYFREELEQASKAGDAQATKLLNQWDTLSKEGLAKSNAQRIKDGKQPNDAHEYAVSEQGLEFIKQQFNLLGETGKQRWWNDTKALLKTRWSNNATLADLRRAINFRFVNEQTRGKYVGKTGPLGPVGKKGGVAGLINRNSEDSDRYNELTNIMKTKPTTEAWLELEALKESYGGETVAEHQPFDNPDQRAWRIKNNRTATGSSSQEYNLPSDLSYGHIYDLGINADPKTLNSLYKKLVELNPELKTIKLGSLLEKRDVVKGVASKFKSDNIKYFIEEHKKTFPNNNSDILREGVEQITKPKTRNQTDDEGLLRRQGGEGRTPYPFTMKELQKGTEFEEKMTPYSEYKSSNLVAPKNENEQAKAYLSPERNQPADEGLTPTGEPVGAERVLLDAAKRTRTYLEWRDAAPDKSDNAFYKAILDDELLRDDVMSEPNVLAALKKASLLPKAKKQAAPKPDTTPAVEKVVSEVTKPEKVKPVVSEETGQKVTPLAAKESSKITLDEARANAARIREQLLKQAEVQDKIEGNDKRIFTTPEESRRKVMEESQRYLEERKKSGRYQGSDEGLTTDPSAQSILPGFAATFDKVKKVDTELAQAGVNWQSRKDSYWGKAQLAEADLSKLPDKVSNSAIAKMDEAYRTGAPLSTLTPAEQQAATAWRQYFKWNVEERRAMGMKVEGREAGANENYVPHMLNDKWIDIFTNKPASPEAAHGKSIWADRVVRESKGEIGRKEAFKNISEYIEAMGSPSKHYTSVNFGALRKAAGYGLPEGMRELSAQKILTRYGRRAANDMAMYRELESQPSIQQKLKLRDPLTGKTPSAEEGEKTFSTTKEVQDMMKWVTGSINENTINHPFVTGATRLVNNLLLGPATGARDTASIPIFVLPYINKFSDLAAFAKGVLHYRENARDALEYAAKQPHIDKVQFGEIGESPNVLLALLRKAATLARTGQGREAIENFNREVVFSGGKELVRNNIIGTKAGHEGSKKFLKRFDTLVDGDITAMEGAELESAINQMAKNFTDANQGTYGGAGLPTWTTEGQLAPFLSLQKWSIEKSNIIFKDVIKPFYTGENRIPLLTYTLGSVLTGAGIQELNKMLTNKKSSDPTWEEALSKGDAKALVSQLATLLQLASFGGIVGDSMKVLSDASKGKTPRNPLSFPAYSSTIDAAENIKNAVNAINDGEDAMEVLTELSTYLMAHNIQSVRMVNNRLDADETARSEKFRDVRAFNELEGKSPTDITQPNRYSGLAAKQYKRTGDLGEAASMLPSLVEQSISRSGGDYEKLSKRLTSLKGNSYQTFPSLENQPVAFQQYYDFLRRTQGEEVANARLADYMRQRSVNKIKSSIVPSF